MSTTLTAFGLVGNSVETTINQTAHTVRVVLPYGTTVTALAAVFAHGGTSVTVGGVAQTSGVSTQDFSSPVTYTVVDGALTQAYVVTVVVSSLDSTNALVTLARMKSYLDISDTTDDARLERSISAASRLLNVLTERDLKARAVTKYLTGDGSTDLRLPNWPVNDSASLQVWESTDLPRVWDATTLIDSNDYVIDTERGEIHYSGGWSEAPLSIKLSANLGYGYGSEEVPDDLQQATMEIAARLWSTERDHLAGRTSVSSPNGSSTTLDNERILTPFAREVVDRYRRYAA